jgi:hypothetical protein
VVEALRAPVDCEPLSACVPLQPPDAVQAVALLVDQLRVALAPFATVLGEALKEMVGGGAGEVTDTLVACVALPPAPVQVSVNVLLALSAPVDCEPLKALLPDQPPEALQAVALFEVQDNVALAPLVTVLGLAVIDTVGEAGVTVTVVD